ncbi:MAG TPA: ABC transporter ATP-binding protein [Propionicimonas sp.]|jgi:ABC-2 type transport system ATP-binding protein|uniref:ABC transporter ATP-binding protein n=1 Tax=Propionicimonas sp. TaxID=1955623 RepID=UPI002F3F67DA
MSLGAEGVTKRFGDLVAVGALDLEARPGAVLAVLGPNGAGKTTTLDMLSGTTRPDSGVVTWEGRAARPGELRRLVGVCPQTVQTWPRLTCVEQVVFLARLYGLGRAAATDRADRLLDRVGLRPKRDAQARTLSGGMLRRLNIALALVSDPPAVVLDEPEAGLDPQSRVLIRDLIGELATGKVVIVTSHDLAEVERVADRILILDHGVGIADGTPRELLEKFDLGRTVDFGTDPDKTDALLAAVRGAGAAATATGDLVTARLADGNGLSALLVAAENSGVPVRAVHTREPSLEDVFLHLTGRGLRE